MSNNGGKGKRIKDKLERGGIKEKKVMKNNCTKKQMTLRLETTLYKELQAMSKTTGLTITSLLIAAIWQNILKQRQ